MRTAIPTLEQVDALPADLELVVPPEFTDANGHMNIARYLEVHSDSGWVAYATFGLGEANARAGGPTTFDAEHFLRYLHEVHAGDRVTVHSRVLGRTAKALHVMQFLVDRTTGEVANTFEALSVSVDLTTRRSAVFPDRIAALLDARIARDAGLPWDAPVCGAIRLR